MHSNRFLSAPALAGLKDFQRKTVEYAFKRLYGSDPTSRFLIADEVGLGKTLVARGIIAKTLEHLQDDVDRVDVIYICSNAAIATQNVNRLNVSDTDGFSIATRLTYLPRQVRSLRKNKVNFISLTPGTAFDHARSRGGHADERVILYRMLYDLPLAQNERRRRLRVGLLNILQATAGKDNWRAKAKNLLAEDLDTDLSKAFRRAVLEDAELYAALKEGCEKFARYRDCSRIPWEDSQLRYDLIGKLRSKLASVCLSALEPDLVILDEFQRFKHLLDGDDEASMLATALFERPGVRVLLLSATPYKMFTLDQENDEDDHYPDFIRTLSFLFNDSGKVDAVKSLLSEHRTTLHVCAKGSVGHMGKKAKLERALLSVMCRTERVATTRDHNSMLTEIERRAPLTPADLQHAATVDAVALCVKAGEPIEYWKSAPYLINFLKHYELRHKLDVQLNAPSNALREILTSAHGQLLTKGKLEGYQALDPANPRMRVLFEDTIDKGMWQLLWMPPSMPYIEPGGVFREKDGLTKALVFSSWSAVPDAIASICSYEAERKMIAGSSVSHSELYDKIKPLLRFAVASNDNRLTGMPVIAWLLPSPTLVTKIDPLEIARRRGSRPLSAQELRDEVKTVCRGLVETLPAGEEGARADKRWYWAAPILLDSQNGLLDWCKSHSGWTSATPDHEFGTHFKDHIDLLVSMAEGNIPLGPQPGDLVDVLCDLALAGPGVCALRALRRVGAGLEADDSNLLSAAARIASGFRSLFNMPETIAMLRGTGEDTYWRLTLQYGIDGNIQSVLDEYVHVLRESLGLQEHAPERLVASIAECIQSVLSLRTAQIRIDEIKISGDGFALVDFNTRCRFALRFGDIRDDNNQALVRADSVRDAFNSPFRPFVLASTSIGQEGLDFHTWCHAVVHWNLPSNPVDLEQREGRVHRYKGHAVRKNVAAQYGLNALPETFKTGDPWQELFKIVSQQKADEHSDLIPYWILEGPARIERRIPILPFSKEVGKLKKLKQGLALYRMVFGQPRQEDLLFSLGQNGTYESENIADWLISLTPP
ncbi:helicase-related protein [Alkalimonas sp. MEB108]|uniref:Helicase-related protein n=1 Tax=Alkalimonas cellulosilytica TaxID=3058395 RepID=A0ABU7JAA8_9GAMM|nr:helicase-related protein [Alkalimonas sp. MEB108]MEE2003364.1 helicase-related protein [Alkalimonas sp. MEB108]